MQIILHYSCSKCPCRFKHFWGHLDSSNYLGPHCSVMNKVFCTSKVCTRWAFKVALHWACVLLLVHEWAEHESQSVSGGKPWLGIHGWRDETRVSPSTHALPLSFKSLSLDSSSCLRMKGSRRFILGKGMRRGSSSVCWTLPFPGFGSNVQLSATSSPSAKVLRYEAFDFLWLWTSASPSVSLASWASRARYCLHFGAPPEMQLASHFWPTAECLQWEAPRPQNMKP